MYLVRGTRLWCGHTHLIELWYFIVHIFHINLEEGYVSPGRLTPISSGYSDVVRGSVLIVQGRHQG